MSLWMLVGVFAVTLIGFFVISGWLRTWLTYRGARVITCPENLQPAAVAIDATRAARWYAVAGETDLRLKSCSRWPEMAGCGQECLSQIEASPDGCLVHSMVAKWYAGRRCVYCARTMEHIVWHERPPALRLPDGSTREWKEIAPEDLPRIFATCEPVCWACHIVESFRREQPRMVIERKHPAEAHHTLPPTATVY